MSDFSRAAVVNEATDIVVNVIMADARYDVPPGGCFLVDASDLYVDIGWFYDRATGAFTPPPEA